MPAHVMRYDARYRHESSLRKMPVDSENEEETVDSRSKSGYTVLVICNIGPKAAFIAAPALYPALGAKKKRRKNDYSGKESGNHCGIRDS